MSKKGDARIQRANKKALKRDRSNARLSESVVVSEFPIRSNITPDIKQSPRNAVDYHAYRKHALSWDINYADLIGRWSWFEDRQWSEQEFNEIIKPRFENLGKISWGEIELQTYDGAGGYRKRMNKKQGLDSVCEEAQARWLELDESIALWDQLFRFRLGNKKRAWGIRFQHHFFLVWYERDHKICPSND